MKIYTAKEVTVMEKINITIDEATELLNIGRASLTEIMESDETFPAFAIGRKILIPVKALEEWANNRGRMRVGVRTVSQAVHLIRQRRRAKRKGRPDSGGVLGWTWIRSYSLV